MSLRRSSHSWYTISLRSTQPPRRINAHGTFFSIIWRYLSLVFSMRGTYTERSVRVRLRARVSKFRFLIVGVPMPSPGRCLRNHGSFRFNLPENGRYMLKVFYKNNPSANIFVSSPNPAQYDFDLVRQGRRTYILVRR